ncbi:MAG: AAA family ATPase [Candidatus Omnitrophota bacterium]|jgi:chromosome partitioning protein
MKTISVSNQKGGCGKTTTAINLAGALVEFGKKVLVIDLDPQSHASFGLGVLDQAMDASIYNVLTDNASKRRPVTKCIVNVSENLDLIPSSILLSTLEQELKDTEDAVSRLYHILSENQLTYDYVVIDCPPSLGFLTFNALRAAELVIVPLDMSAFSLMGVGKLLGMLELIKLKIHHEPRVKALATIFDKRTKYAQTMLVEIRNFFKSQMLETVIRSGVSLKKAAMAGVPVIKLEKDSNGSIDHLALAKEIMLAEGDIEFERAMAEVSEGTADASALKIVPRSEIVFGANEESPREEVAVSAPASQEPEPRAAEAAQAVQESAPRSELVKAIEEVQNIAAEPAAPQVKDTIFFINTPNAKDVFIAGEFNQWKVDTESRLSRMENGIWEKRVALNPGKYRYRFVVDGEWMMDAKNSEKEPNPYGSFDSVIKL